MVGGDYNIIVQQGVKYDLVISDIEDEEMVDATALTWTAEVRNSGDDTVLFSPTVTAPLTNQLKLSLSALQTASLNVKGTYVYDIVDSTKTFAYLKGSVIVERGRTS
jgi:hypothetical protein